MLALLISVSALSVLVTCHAYAAVLLKLRKTRLDPRSTSSPHGGARHGARSSATANRPGISILKPLKGEDDELYENLVAFTRLEYDCYELLCGAEDPSDPALAVARRVQRENPSCALRIFSGAAWVGLNPKVRVLSRLAPEARYDWILISDSNVRPRPDYLSALMACQERTGAELVHSVLGGAGERSPGAILENLHMNSWVVGAVCLADASGHACVIGKSMLLRRSELSRLGGFEAVRDVLAEDYILGQMFARAGHRVELSAHVLPTLNTMRSLSCYLNRHIRWGQLRRRLSLAGFVGELLFNPTPWLAALATFGSPVLQLAACVGILCKVGADLLLAAKLRGAPPSVRLMPWVLMKDFLTLAMWMVSALRTRVSWRGNQMRIGPGTRLVPADPLLETAESQA
jgi:ceramide glucosyltransferase